MCKSDMKVDFKLNTTVHGDGTIHSMLDQKIGHQAKTITHWIVSTREKQVIKALVDLGWTPPKTNREAAGK